MPSNNPKKLTYLATDGGEVSIVNGMLNANSYIGKKGTLDVLEGYGAIAGNLGGELLPRNLMWISSDKRSMILVQEPEEKAVKFEFGPQDILGLGTATIRLQMPTLVFGINQSTGSNYHVKSVFCTTSNSLKALTPFPFWNIHKDGNVCTFFAKEYDTTGMALVDEISMAIDTFWSSIFNTEVKDFSGRQFIRCLTPRYLGIDTQIEFLKYLIEHNEDIYGGVFNEEMIATAEDRIMNFHETMYFDDSLQSFINAYHQENFSELAFQSPELTNDHLINQPFALQMYTPILIWHLASIAQDGGKLVNKLLSRAVQGEFESSGKWAMETVVNQVLYSDDTSIAALSKFESNATVASLLNRLSVNTIDEPIEIV